jgi:hypothetical protein
MGNWSGFGCIELSNNEKYTGALYNNLPHGVGVFNNL